MIKQTLTMVTCLTLIATAVPAASTPGEAQGPAVSEVLVFDSNTSLPKFLELSKRANAIATKYGSRGKPRTWITAYAGPNTGSIVVVVEYPNMAALAESTTKIRMTPEWRQLVADAQASSVRVVSDSIVVEVTEGM